MALRATGAWKLAVLVLSLVMAGSIVHKTQMAMDASRKIRFVDRRPVFLPRGEVLKWMSMGYRGLVGDWLWIRSVIYYGRRVVDHDNRYLIYAESKGDTTGLSRHYAVHHHGEAEGEASPRTPEEIQAHLRGRLMQADSKGLVDHIYPMLDRATTVDPHFIFPYIFGGLYVLLDTGEIEEAYGLLEKGYRNNPERWEFPFYLGWLEWMYLGNLDKTSSFLLEAVGKEGCPGYVGTLLAGLARNLGQGKMTVLYLQGLLESTDNPEIRERIQEVLTELGDES